MLTIEELALAYELRQSGLCWKLVARELGGDDLLIAAQISHLCRHGIHKGLDGYARQGGRPARFPLDLIRKAHRLRRAGYGWQTIGWCLNADPEALRKAWRYAAGRGLIKAPRRS